MRVPTGLTLALFASWLLVSCGPGGSTWLAGVGSGGTGGSVSSGPITGFGSIVVNGVKFDDTGARVTIDGVPDRAVSELKLGMVVDVRGVIRSDGTGKADEISATLSAQGPVASVDASTATLRLLGQRVRADSHTVLDGFASIDAIAPGDVIAVSGLKDVATGEFAATRIERRPSLPASATPIAVQGSIAGLTGTTFRIDELTVSYSGAQLLDLPAGGLTNGLAVAVTAAQPPTGGLLVAASVRNLAVAAPEGTKVEYTGYISNFASPARFQVGTLTVNAANAAFVGGSAANLSNGAKVEIEGTSSAGVVNAVRIELLSIVPPPTTVIEGTVTDFISVANFQVRGQRVDATNAHFTGGSAAALANGRSVRLTGMISGSVYAAVSVEFTDTMPPEAERLAVDGLVSDFVSPASFKVNGRAVTTISSTVFSGGSVGDLANGRHVAAEGVVMGGVLNAATLTIYPVQQVPTVTTAGLIANFVSPASFTVNGQAVSASASTAYVSGTAASLANGVSVVVTGTISSGVLAATSIEIKPREDDSKAEAEGYITNFVSPSNFKVQGQIVDASTATYEHGTSADLANGLKVHATGRIANGVLKATLLQIDR